MADLPRHLLAAILAEPEDDLRIAETRFVVEATDAERLYVWLDWKDRPCVRSWDDQTIGLWIEVGRINDMPVGLSLRWVRINGHLVLFYSCVSRMSDYEMIQEWLKKTYPVRWGGGTRWAHCDVLNFHHCMDALRELEGEEVAGE